MNVVGGQLDFGGTAFDGLSLLEGERVETTLNLLGETEDPKDGDTSKTARWKWGKNPPDSDLLVLTDRRLIHLVYNASERESAFVSLSAVSAVRMDARRPGRAAGFVWGGISLVAAALLWAVWDQPVLDVAAAGAVVLMGLYILLDYVMAPHAVQMTISAGLSQMTMGVHGSISTQRMNDFANRVFEAKANAQYPGVGGWPLDTVGADDIYGRGEGTPGVSHAYGQEEAPDATLQSEDAVVPDDSLQWEDAVAPDDTLQWEDAVAPDDTLQREDAVAPDDTLQREDAVAPDDTPQEEDVAVPDDIPQGEDAAAPDDSLQGEDVGAPAAPAAVEDAVVPDVPAAVEDAGVPDAPAAAEDAGVPDDTPQWEDAVVPDAPAAVEDAVVPDAPAAVEDAVVPDAPAAVEDAAVPDAPAAAEDAAPPDDSSEPSGSDPVESGESLAKRGDDSSPAVGSSGQS